MPKPAKPTLIFDFDGTIADTFAEFVKIFSTLSPHYALTPTETMYLRGLSAKQIISHFHIPFWRIPSMLSRGRREFGKVVPKVAMFPGLAEVLRDLHAQGYPMCVVSSNSTRNIHAFLAAHKAEAYFDKVIGGVGIFGKQTAIKKIMKIYGLPIEQYILIGDEVRDVEVAKKLKIPCIAVTYGYNNEAALTAHKPDFMARTPADIYTVLSA